MRPVNQLPLSLIEMKRSPLASSRNPDSPPKPRKLEVRISPLRYSREPNRTRARSRVSKEGIGRGVDLDRDWRCDREFVRGRLLRRRLRCKLRPRDLWYRSGQKPRRRGLQKAAAGEMRWFIPHGEEARLRRLEP